MKDYEQLYFDECYKNKILKTRYRELEEELELLKNYTKKNIVKKISNDLKKYKKEKNEEFMKEEIINKLTELLLKQEFIDRKNQKERYVKKTRIYKDLIKWFKENL